MSEICKTSIKTHVKECAECKEVKSLDQFQRLKPTVSDEERRRHITPSQGRYRSICNICRNAQKRDAGLRARYGIGVQEYNQLLESQNGVCAICKETCPTGRNLAVDHSHKSGKVRGLLCVRCNQGLGHFMDSEELITRMLEYARKHRDE